MTDHLRRIREHMALETEGLLLEAKRARLWDQSTNRGTEAEQGILRWLRARLAPHHTVSSGEIIDSFGTTAARPSRQQDGVVHENAPEAARFLLPSGMRLLPIETVRAVVEVKLTLSRDEFERADTAARETSELRLRPGPHGMLLKDMDGTSNHRKDDLPSELRAEGIAVSEQTFTEPPVLFTLFAFGGIERVDTIRDWLRNSTISIVCCLTAGCVVRRGYQKGHQVRVGAHDGDIVVEAKDSLWDFAEAIAQCVRRQGAIVDALEPDFDWYAPYERRVIPDGRY